MATHRVEEHVGLLARFLTIRVAVPARSLSVQRSRPTTGRPVVSRDEAQELLHQMLLTRPKETTPIRRELEDLAICSRIRKALYS